jgi:hypothetical protein
MGRMRLFQWIAAVGLLTGALVAGAQATTPVNVAVSDPEGAAIARAVILTTSPGSSSVITGADGTATLRLATGSYDVLISSTGFVPQAKHLDVHQRPLDLHIVMAVCPPDICTDVNVDVFETGTPKNLTISAGPNEHVVLTPAQLKAYPHQSVTVVNFRTKKSETYSGVPLMDLLAPLGVPHGERMMGPKVAQYVVATGADSYKSVMSLGEVDPAFHSGMVPVADTLDGKPPDAKAGPFRLVLSEDRNQTRGVWNLVAIEVKQVE